MIPEATYKAQLYLFFLASCFLLIFVIYIYIVCPIHTSISHDHKWNKIFIGLGMNKDDIDKLSHDSEVWYYERKNLCVAYGSDEERCPHHFSYCAGHTRYGTDEEQAQAVIDAINNGNIHKLCPLI
jgi:hypothetical protein